ncbi:glycoside hydrolase family 127 protein [Olivibacter domesticus]|uniref:Uncharacterized protein n=1 Tax=Olivibacter domesticus TaxID=407022 RepID=A0A1H7TPJ0_OLID1|nr:beta-L-arabinofuranosidase domain-containing protein [Olivibacter domesticus]SEL86286.1 hypothetical protein SAMN05661044_03615 [Olivibacter domesticus]
MNKNTIIYKVFAFAFAFATNVWTGLAQTHKDYPIQPVPFTHVQVNDNFWAPKMQVNANVTIPYILNKCYETGRVDNFRLAAGEIHDHKLTEYTFDDTDLYKLIEGASYALQVKKDPKLDAELDKLIIIIGKAQEDDGYLYTFRTAKVSKPHPWIGSKRWEMEEDLSHELYNAGHLYEAAVAHYLTTGKKTLLTIATKNADLLVKDFGYGKEERFPGHQIIETGLTRLYRVTGKQEYLDLAKFFLDIRGPGKPHSGEYNQSFKKVTEQEEAVGHAVRATYMYTGMADVAALTGDQVYLTAIDKLWDNVVDKKLYITGGIGATGAGEAFGKNYQLPNMSAYAETCAAIANVYWNSRMFQLHGDAKYIDVLERTLYNGLLSGVSLSGDHFFYPNPLASMGQHQRSAWFGCACCISNMTRFLPSMPGYMYGQDGNNLYINLYAGSEANIDLPKGTMQVVQQTNYPWEGSNEITINPAENMQVKIHVRIPGWAQGDPLPSNLYRENAVVLPAVLKLNGKQIDYTLEKGYAILDRTWKKGDRISLVLPMEVQKVFANEQVEDDQNRFALQRGPIVYCLEGPDNLDSTVMNIVVDKDATVQPKFENTLLNGVMTLKMKGNSTKRQVNSDELIKNEQEVTAIPYYAWANRGPSEMEVWIPYEASAAKPKPAPTIASKSKVSGSIKNARMLRGLNDQYDPKSSADASSIYLHWWPAKDTEEYVQYDFDRAYTVSQSSVYWYDDSPFGGCRIPASWKLQYLDGTDWKDVKNTGTYPNDKDSYNKVSFEPVNTKALRLLVQQPKEHSSGIQEWSIK